MQQQTTAILRPGEPGWDQARAAWNLVADQHPAAVVYAESPEDVAQALAFARSAGLRVAVQGTGHGAGCRAALADSVLIRTERMSGIEIDPERGVGRFEAGVVWEQAAAAAAAHGLAVPSGSAPDIGVVGYTTGGGFGWLGRRHGLACNLVVAAEVVTADGGLLRIDRDHEPDLFWALRGGGGSFAVVTALEFELVALESVYAGSVLYPADERALELLTRWVEWTREVPDEITSIARFLHLPDIPQVPAPLRDRPLVTIGACHAGNPREGERIIAPLRELAEPVMDLFATMSPAGLVRIHMDPEEPVPGIVDTASLHELTGDALAAFVEVLGPSSGSPLLMAELRQAGGALSRPAPGGGALSHLDAAFLFEGIGMAMAPEHGEAINRHIDLAREALAGWCTDRRYFNFADRPSIAIGEIFDADTLTRLGEIKRRYDPDDLLSANHAVAVA